ILLIAINWAASVWHSRIDLTNEKRFTLSEPSKKLLYGIKEPITIDVFLKGNYPSGFKKLSVSTEEILNEFKEIAGSRFQYNFISPDEIVPGSGVSYGDTLMATGLYPINLTSQVKQGQQQQYVYPFALVHYKEKTVPVVLYKGKTPLINSQELNSAEALLEYNLANAIAKITTTNKPAVAYATGNGEPMDYRTYDLAENVLNIDYEWRPFDLNGAGPVPVFVKVLLIVKQTIPFSEDAKLKIDQYVMNGGKLLLFIDRLNAEMDSLQVKNEVIAYDRDLKLNDLLFKYGARINADLVMDLQCDFLPFDVNGNGQFDLLPWNYFPLLETKSNHVINKNLGFVAARFANSIDTIAAEGITKTMLLSSSANARKIASPALISGKENVNAPEDEKFKTSDIPVAVLLEGKFQSYFKNRLSANLNDSLKAYGENFLPGNIKDNKMIVVADADIVMNSIVKGEPIPMGMNAYTYGTQREFPFANKDFVKNCLDYLVNFDGLAQAKSKDYVVRLLDKQKVIDQEMFWRIINIVIPILVIILFGLFFQWSRKKKYTKRL
ncbi:MAG: gliding motility-associated ABC transporter substrate-binding protein GldG, partial [Ferruginibacter sp.]